mgnify:CR=1 FL=1
MFALVSGVVGGCAEDVERNNGRTTGGWMAEGRQKGGRIMAERVAEQW